MPVESSWIPLIKQLALLWPLCLVIGLFGGWFMLRPLRQAAKTVSAPTQFRLTDFLVLLAVLLASGWAPAAYYQRATQTHILVYVLFLHALFIAWWWWGLRLLARADVRTARTRAVALGVAIPLVCGGSLAFVAAPVLVSDMIAEALKMTGDVQGRGSDLVDFLLGATKVVPFWALLGFADFWGGRQLAHWIVKHRVDGEPEEDEPF